MKLFPLEEMLQDIRDTQLEISSLYGELMRVKNEIDIRKTFVDELQLRIERGQYIKPEPPSVKLTVKGILWTVGVYGYTEWDGSSNTFYSYYLDQFGLSECISILDRMTGFSYGRDIETGYRDREGRFWLASGDFDIRRYPELTLAEAIEKIKANANNCRGE